MTVHSKHPHSPRGGAPVGFLTELSPVEVAAVLYLRLWSDGDVGRSQMYADFRQALGADYGRRQQAAFCELCEMCVEHGRRPLMRHHLTCTCLGADESCFANFIASAAEGSREDAILIATLIVRPDIAFGLVDLAQQVGLAFRRMVPAGPVAQYDDIPAILH